MKKITRRAFLEVLGLGAIAGVLTACGGSGDSTAASTGGEAKTSTLGLTPLAERTTLSIGFFAGSAHGMPYYVADKMGFFDELNIDVEYQSFTGGPAMMEASADWDICDVGGPGVLNGMKKIKTNPAFLLSLDLKNL